MAMFATLDLIIKIMDDKYLKTIFWLLVGLYTLAIIGLWESLIKPDLEKCTQSFFQKFIHDSRTIDEKERELTKCFTLAIGKVGNVLAGDLITLEVLNNPSLKEYKLTLSPKELQKYQLIVENCMNKKEIAQESGRCLRCDHFGFGIFKGGREKLW